MKIPFLHNVRRGLATNSSSSHSLVFYAAPVASPDVASAAYVDTDFGWNHFILATLGEKLMYGLTSAIGGGWRQDQVSPAEVQAARTKYGHLFPELTDESLWVRAIEGSVDHQSVSTVDEEFVAKLRDPHTILHGGNDNGGYPFDEDWGKDSHLPEGATREMLG